ncbi:hypothetical protein C2G38_2039072 [Gigaspora rosea]|uniref:Uncharacterized protein n=1 Tax=Gigaspora rosea TaxID=44941 RepID=A0A397V1L7_9GLOM|nr:hypothetical protein C2G38_2039072 [Gigaspora rosea]
MTVSNYAAFHIMLISKRWYNDEKQIEPESETRQHLFIFGLDSTKASIIIEQTFSNLSFRLPNISFSDVHTKINHRKAYVTANSLSKKAIQTGIDAGPNAIKELESFMSSFISKYAPKSNKKMNRKRFERQLNDEDETTSNSSSSDKENFIDIENPIVHSKRGAPRKKQLKGSNKLVNKHISGAKQQSEIHKTRK